MDTTTSKIHYRNWVIEKETEPWPVKYGIKYRYYREGVSGEKIYSASTVEHAMEEIDEKENNPH